MGRKSRIHIVYTVSEFIHTPEGGRVLNQARTDMRTTPPPQLYVVAHMTAAYYTAVHSEPDCRARGFQGWLLFSRGRYVSAGGALYAWAPFLCVAAVLVWQLGPLFAATVWAGVAAATLAALAAVDAVARRFFRRRELEPAFEAKHGPAPHTWARGGAGFWDATLRPMQYLVHDPVLVLAGDHGA